MNYIIKGILKLILQGNLAPFNIMKSLFCKMNHVGAWEEEHILRLTDAPSSYRYPLIFDSIELISQHSNIYENGYSSSELSDNCIELLSIFSRFSQGCISLSWMVKAYMDPTLQNLPLENKALVLRKMRSSYKYICHGQRFSNVDPFNFDVTQTLQGLDNVGVSFGVSGSSYDDFYVRRNELKTRFGRDAIKLANKCLNMKRLELAFENFVNGVHEFINEQIHSVNRREPIRVDDVDMSFNIHSRQDEIETLPLYFADHHWICFFRRVLVDDEDPISATFIDEIKSKRIDWPDTRSGFVYPTNVQHQSDDESEDTEDEGGINILQHGDDIEDEAILDDVDIGGNDDNPPIAHVVSDVED